MASRGRAALRIALAFGLLAGLGEGAGLWLAQEHFGTKWSVFLSSGPEVIWVAPLVDALLFFGCVALAIGAARIVRRPLPLALVVAACSAALVGDWARVTKELARSTALGGALLLGVVAWFAVRRREEAIARAARVAAPILAIVTLLCAATIEGVRHFKEASAEAKLPTPPAGARDVIVIVLDTVRSDHLSAYGYARRTTPALEKLAAEGVRFDSCFSTSSWTLPAHASMLTGRLPWEHGAALEPMDGTWPVLGEELLAHGFRTGAFSGNLCFFIRRFGFGRGFSHFDDFGWSWGSRIAGTLAGRELLDLAGTRMRDSFLRKSARDVTDAFLAWIDRAPDRPAFAFLNWFDAHCPYHAPAEFAGRFAGDAFAAPPLQPGEPARPGAREGAALARDIEAYDECILGMDTELARLTAELARRGRLDRSVIVVVGDHGESFGERGTRFHRGSLNREQVQVPLIVRAPGLAPAGVVADGVASIASLPATLLDLLGLPPDPFPGPSLAPLWRDHAGAAGEDGAAVLELARHPWPEYRRRACYDGALRAIVRGRWHYVWHETHGPQLFDRLADPREEHDVKEEHPEIAAALGRELEADLAARTRHPREPSGLDLADRPDLAGVGYVDDGK